MRHLISQERLPFTATYFGSIALTLYFAVGVSPTLQFTTTNPPAPTVDSFLVRRLLGRARSRRHTTSTTTTLPPTISLFRRDVDHAGAAWSHSCPDCLLLPTHHQAECSVQPLHCPTSLVLPYLTLRPPHDPCLSKPDTSILGTSALTACAHHYRLPSRLQYFATILDLYADVLDIAVTKHHSHSALVDCANRGVGVVPRQLLSHGITRSSVCGEFWRQQDRGLDARLIAYVLYTGTTTRTTTTTASLRCFAFLRRWSCLVCTEKSETFRLLFTSVVRLNCTPRPWNLPFSPSCLPFPSLPFPLPIDPCGADLFPFPFFSG